MGGYLRSFLDVDLDVDSCNCNPSTTLIGNEDYRSMRTGRMIMGMTRWAVFLFVVSCEDFLDLLSSNRDGDRGWFMTIGRVQYSR